MMKEYPINDILSAVSSISKLNREKSKASEIKNNLSNKDDISSHNNQVKPHKRDILVLDEMIE